MDAHSEPSSYSPINTKQETSLQGLIEARHQFFPGGHGVDHAEFSSKASAFYQTLNLDQRGDVWTFLDHTALEVSLEAADFSVRQRAKPECPLSRRLLVIGCGDGRLAAAYIRLASRLGLGEVIFNDLFEFHLRKTREKVEALDFDRGALKVSYISGDFAAIDLNGDCDIAVAMFFVSSEILDLQSVEALNARRSAFFKAVRRVLHPAGVFVEDTPEMTWPGFYSNLRQTSETVLKGVSGLGDEVRNFTLTALEKREGAFPYHVRYMPKRERHIAERLAHGFQHVDSWTIPAATPQQRLERWKRIALWGM